jgi:bacterioferritin (cytochrome b1)
MKAQEGVINILNKVLTVKLMAINQHFGGRKRCQEQ